MCQCLYQAISLKSNMGDMTNPQAILTDAQKQAIRWHSRINEAGCSLKVRQNFESWLAQSSENKAAFEMIQLLWNDYAQLSLLGDSELNQARKFAKQTQVANKRRNTSLLLGLMLIGVLAVEPNIGLKLLAHHYQTTKGQSARAELSDGSFVQINTDSDIRVFDFLGTKKVWMARGEAWFDIHHDPANEFLVVTNHGTIRDIGTRFNVLAENNKTTVSVEEGGVELETQDNRHLNVFENQQAVLDMQGNLTSEANIDLATIASWRSGVLTFQNKSLSEVLQQISRYHQVEFTINDSSLKQKTISGRFSTTNLAGTLHTLSVGMNINITQYQPGKFSIRKL